MKIQKGAVTLKLKRKAETDEWVVEYYNNGNYSESKTSYHTDKQDAIDTMNATAARLKESPAKPIKTPKPATMSNERAAELRTLFLMMVQDAYETADYLEAVNEKLDEQDCVYFESIINTIRNLK